MPAGRRRNSPRLEGQQADRVTLDGGRRPVGPRSPQKAPQTQEFSEHRAELRAPGRTQNPANNSHDLNSTRCKAVYTGSIPVVASEVEAGAGPLGPGRSRRRRLRRP